MRDPRSGPFLAVSLMMYSCRKREPSEKLELRLVLAGGRSCPAAHRPAKLSFLSLKPSIAMFDKDQAAGMLIYAAQRGVKSDAIASFGQRVARRVQRLRQKNAAESGPHGLSLAVCMAATRSRSIVARPSKAAGGARALSSSYSSSTSCLYRFLLYRSV